MDGSWEYPPLDEAMQELWLEDFEVYVRRRHNTVVQYITERPIMDLCEEEVRSTGAWVAKFWWYQEVIDIEGAWTAAEAEGEEEPEEAEG